MHHKGPKKIHDYYHGKLNNASHSKTGEIEIGDKVRAFGSHSQFGVVKSITRGNFGQGRPVAVVEWENGRTTNEPLYLYEHVRGLKSNRVQKFEGFKVVSKYIGKIKPC